MKKYVDQSFANGWCVRRVRACVRACVQNGRGIACMSVRITVATVTVVTPVVGVIAASTVVIASVGLAVVAVLSVPSVVMSTVAVITVASSATVPSICLVVVFSLAAAAVVLGVVSSFHTNCGQAVIQESARNGFVSRLSYK